MSTSTANDPTPAPLGQAARLKPRKYKFFMVANALVVLLVSIASVSSPFAQIGIGFYIVALFIVCTFPLLYTSSYRGRASLMLLFLAFYFATFGLKDLSTLIAHEPFPDRSLALLTGSEIAILIGAVAFMAGYALTVGLIPKHSKGILVRDWKPNVVVIAGLVFWLIGALSNTYIQFVAGDPNSYIRNALGPWGGFVALFRILGPLGTLMLIYSFLTSRSKSVLLFLLATMVIDFGLGFLGDSKETAMRAPLLFLFSYVVIREKIPLVATTVFVLLFALAFNFFATYRDYLATRGISRTDAATSFDSRIDNILAGDRELGERFSDGLDYFASRVTLKHNVDLIVSRTGKDVDFQEGYTIKPLLYAFIPRFIMPEKQDATQTGRIFNREFNIGYRDTYISVSHLGDLYWNWGWAGLILGMVLIGLVMASIATLARADRALTLPRFLLLLLTVYLLILRFEGGLAMTYTYWARAVVLFLLIHMVIPKTRIRPLIQEKKSVETVDEKPGDTRILSRAVKPLQH